MENNLLFRGQNVDYKVKETVVPGSILTIKLEAVEILDKNGKPIYFEYDNNFDWSKLEYEITVLECKHAGGPWIVETPATDTEHGKEVRYCSNRKEVKDHGDTGILLGSPIKDGDKVVIIEDVTTSGKSIEETFPIIKAQGDVEIKGLMVSLNRMERGKGAKSALDEIKDLYGFPTAAIVSMADVVEHLYNKEIIGKVVIDDQIKAAIDAYYEQYGAQA